MPKYAHFDVACGMITYHYAVITHKGECTLLDLKKKIEEKPKEGMRKTGNWTADRMRLQFNNGNKWDESQPDLNNEDKFDSKPGRYSLRIKMAKKPIMKTTTASSSSVEAASAEEPTDDEEPEMNGEPEVDGECEMDNDEPTDDDEPQPTKRCVIS